MSLQLLGCCRGGLGSLEASLRNKSPIKSVFTGAQELPGVLEKKQGSKYQIQNSIQLETNLPLLT